MFFKGRFQKAFFDGHCFCSKLQIKTLDISKSGAADGGDVCDVLCHKHTFDSKPGFLICFEISSTGLMEEATDTIRRLSVTLATIKSLTFYHCLNLYLGQT